MAETTPFDMPKFEMPKLPGVDTEAMMAAQRRNIEAMTSATQILSDGVKTFAQRQAEIVQTRMDEFAIAGEKVFKQDVKNVDAVAVIDEVKASYEKALSDMEELGSIMTQAQSDVMNVMKGCVMANFDDMKKLAKPAK